MKRKLFSLMTLLLCAATGAWADETTATYDFGGTSDAVAGNLDAWTVSLPSENATANVILGLDTGSGKTIKKGGSNYTGAIFELYNHDTGATTTLTTKTSYVGISKVTFNITGSDAGKSYLTVQISPDADFSVPGNIVTLIDNKQLKENLSVTSNGVFSSQTCNLEEAATGYLRFTFKNNDTSAKKYYELDDVVITYDPSAADTREGLTLSFTPDNKNIAADEVFATTLSWTEDTSSESAKYTVTYASSNEDVATVDTDGNVTGVAVGSATITATVTAAADATYKTTKATITVNVVSAFSLDANVVVPTATLDMSSASAASDMLINGTWVNDRTRFGNDGADNYITYTVYGGYQSRASQTWCNVSTDGEKYGASADNTWEATGVFGGSAAYNAEKSATSRVGNRVYTYYSYRVTGVSKIQALVKVNSSSQHIFLAAFEMTGDTPASTTLDYVSSQTTSNHVLTVALDESKTYLIALYGDGDGNNQLYEVALFFDESVELYETITTALAAGNRTYATHIAAADLDFSSVSSDITAYIATGLNDAGTAVVIEPVSQVPADAPILVKTATEGATVNVPLATSTPDALTTNLFVKGNGKVINTTTDADTYYYLADNLFHKATSGTLKSGKAYLKLEGVAPASAHALTIGFDEEATGIQTVESGVKSLLDGEFYNIAGQRVAMPQKGLYIVNGKKVIVK